MKIHREEFVTMVRAHGDHTMSIFRQERRTSGSDGTFTLDTTWMDTLDGCVYLSYQYRPGEDVLHWRLDNWQVA